MAQKERGKAFTEGVDFHRRLIDTRFFIAALGACAVIHIFLNAFILWLAGLQDDLYLLYLWGLYLVWFVAIAVIVGIAIKQRLEKSWALVTAGLWFFWALWLVNKTLSYSYLIYYQVRYLDGASSIAVLTLYINAWTLGAFALMTRVWINTRKEKGWKRLAVGSFAAALLASYPLASAATALSSYLPPAFWEYIPHWTYPVVTPFLMIGVGIASLWGVFSIGWQGFFTYLAAFIVVFSFLLNIDNQLAMWRYSKRGILSYAYRFWYWLRGVALPEPPPDESKGARFADPREVETLRNPEGAAFGWTGGKPFTLHTEKHVLIMASTRSGKGRALIIPHLLRYRGSAFVLDPKGENAKATWRQRRVVNDKVLALDPFGITGKPRARFNPLSRFTTDTMDSDSKALANALVIATGREQDPHFTGAAQQLLAGIILHVYTSGDVPPEHKDLVTVRRMLLGDIKGTLKEMSYSDAVEGRVADLAFSFLDTPDKERGSIISVAQRQTEILDNPYIAACLSANGEGEEVNFKHWRTGTMSVFLCLSAPKFPVFNRWLRLVLTAALDEMTDTLEPPPLPVCFMLDELATLGHLPAVENAIGLAAGYGVQLWSVFQDVAQMKDLYKARWASFIGNAGVRAVFNLDDYDTAHYWSQFIGGRIMESYSRQENLYGLSQGQAVGETFRPLLSPEELMTDYAAFKMLVLAQGQHPIQTGRVFYDKDMTLTGLWDDPRYAVPPIPAPKIKKMSITRDNEPQATATDDNSHGLGG
jgi:type IV secretion system protein VirD4